MPIARFALRKLSFLFPLVPGNPNLSSLDGSLGVLRIYVLRGLGGNFAFLVPKT
jgi:hypothetical protein